MKLILVTGMSGAGKSIALKTLEDAGFEAIDNLPLAFLSSVAGSALSRSLAVGADIRGRDFSIERFTGVINSLRATPGIDFKMVFLDCNDEVLCRRFTETRRRHPLALDRTIPDGIRHERELISGLREVADEVLDTSDYEAADLRRFMDAHFAQEKRELSILLTSFSFKHGIPREADMVFDVRFLKNPYYDSKLKNLNGMYPAVGAYVESDRDFAAFYENLVDLILPLLPRYVEEGKHYLTIAVGCTGGQHRSVHVAQKLGAFLQTKGYNVTSRHRDIT